MNEEELVYQLKQESQDAFNRIYNMYSARLYAYCMQYVKSREDTEEIVQDVFIKLWINRHSIIHGSYVFEEYVNYYNEEQCSVSDTSAIVEYDDFCKSLKKAMKNLSSTQREVIECVKLNQMSVKETAVKLRLKEQTVKNALSAGLKVLKEILKKSLVLILSFVLK
ncbi:MAG: hypothetical protein BHV68_18950 [Bacteroidales bacterium 43_8]|nr:MAG: hypothetical protein BHV68_18950 [Bacteroidales bacterium 43_8]